MCGCVCEWTLLKDSFGSFLSEPSTVKSKQSPPGQDWLRNVNPYLCRNWRNWENALLHGCCQQCSEGKKINGEKQLNAVSLLFFFRLSSQSWHIHNSDPQECLKTNRFTLQQLSYCTHKKKKVSLSQTIVIASCSVCQFKGPWGVLLSWQPIGSITASYWITRKNEREGDREGEGCVSVGERHFTTLCKTESFAHHWSIERRQELRVFNPK